MAPQRPNFGALTVTQLIEMRDQIQSAIEEKIQAERAELQGRLDRLNAFGGNSVSSGRGRGRRAANGRSRAHPLKGIKAPIKYKGPAGETWSGRGLAPRWLAALEKKGKKRDTYLVAQH